MRNIGIICEGPTDYIILKEIVDRITGENNYYVPLQPEPDLEGKYGNGWKGVWKWLGDLCDICIAVPCDSMEAWIVAAYDEKENVEGVEDPWTNIIAKKKFYHNIKISGAKKRPKIFQEFVKVVCSNWSKVTGLCVSVKRFEDHIVALFNPPETQISVVEDD